MQLCHQPLLGREKPGKESNVASLAGSANCPYPARLRLAVICLVSATAVVLVMLSQLPARALTVSETPTPVTGNATFFDGLGSPYGGCGLPQSVLESQNFVALNVFNTPGDYTFYPRPLPASLADKIGMWNNGLNCGRWVQVSIGDICTGINDGAPNQPFCRNGSWVSDAYNGATLTMLVADSCGDANAWCRDDPYHLDLAKDSLNRFLRGGSPVDDMYPNHWNNRRVTWSFVPAPNYTGDIQIGFLQGAQRWWPAISVSRLRNGIHGVEFLANGVWRAATMNSDMGQSYIIGGTTSGGTQFQIRIRDASGALINNGRVYSFTLPSTCSNSCGTAYNQVSYTTNTPTAGPTPTTAGPTPTTGPTPTPSRTLTPTPTISDPPPTSATTSTTAPRACSASYAITNAWSGGFQAEVTVRNTGLTAISSWRVTWTFANGQVITQLWNGTLSASGANVVVTNASWNGSVAVNATTSFGFTANVGANNVIPVTACTAT